jgi:heme exporter protein D
LLVLVLALGAVLLAGARSAAGRMLDLAEYRARSPYYQAAALRAQMAGDDGSGSAWVFVTLAVLILVVVALVALRPTLREIRLMRRRSRRPRRQPAATSLPSLPTLPRLPAPRLPAAGEERTLEH